MDKSHQNVEPNRSVDSLHFDLELKIFGHSDSTIDADHIRIVFYLKKSLTKVETFMTNSINDDKDKGSKNAIEQEIFVLSIHTPKPTFNFRHSYETTFLKILQQRAT